MDNAERTDSTTTERTNAERTIEMVLPNSEGPGSRPEPVFPESTTLEGRVPEGVIGKRPSPALDPLSRTRVGRFAKWVMLVGILFFVAWLPAALYNTRGTKTGDDAEAAIRAFNLALVAAATVFAAAVATGVPRALLPRVFGRYHEAVEALRDWLIVGVISGFVYIILLNIAKAIHYGPPTAVTLGDWLTSRLPLLIIAGVVGLFGARFLAIRRDSVVGSGAIGVVQVLIQAVLLGLLERPFEKAILGMAQSNVSLPLGVMAALCAAGALGILTWAANVDAGLATIRRRRGGSGVDDGTGPVDLTLTVIGGRESGKTVLLAAAFYEWSTQNIGNLRITPALDARIGESSGSVGNLEAVARELYVNNQFPVGTVSTQNLPFDLSIGNERISRFTFLDYPGGAIAGRVADAKIIEDFWNRVEDTDGIILIADMSYVRRAHKDKDWLEVRNAYRTVMQRLVDRNGKRRVVPVALVLTKCDEFVNPTTGHIDMVALKAGLKEFQYDELEEEWRRMNDEHGPGFVEFTTWITSAITYSQPQRGADGRADYSKPFLIAPPPPTITPTGCASPLLWMCSKAMRWNVTIFYDISTFLFGSTPQVRRRVDAVLEMERIAEERAGKA